MGKGGETDRQARSDGLTLRNSSAGVEVQGRLPAGTQGSHGPSLQDVSSAGRSLLARGGLPSFRSCLQLIT